MKNRSMSALFAAALATSICVGPALADPIADAKKEAEQRARKEAEKLLNQPAKDAKTDAKDTKSQTPAQPQMSEADQKMMEMMAKLAEPGDAHKPIAKFAGTWNADMKMWMNPEQKEPMAGKGVMVCTPLHGDRYLRGEYSSEFMGQPFTGTMTWGYNNVTKEYESTWIDSMSTWTLVSKGTASPDGKIITSNASWSMPGPDGQPMQVKQREVMTWKDDNTVMYDMYHTYAGAPEMRVMEITYTRATPAPTTPAKAPAADEVKKAIQNALPDAMKK